MGLSVLEHSLSRFWTVEIWRTLFVNRNPKGFSRGSELFRTQRKKCENRTPQRTHRFSAQQLAYHRRPGPQLTIFQNEHQPTLAKDRAD